MLLPLILAAPAHADLRGAYRDYQKGDYAHAFQEFVALAKLGQPQAQFVVAEMYHDGQGTDASDIHAYAWAILAASGGEAHGKALAEKVRPNLAPGSVRIAAWVTLPYTPTNLGRTLLPDSSSPSAQTADASQPESSADCKRKEVRMYPAAYPTSARTYDVEGRALVEFMLMPDGRARFPQIIYAVPGGVFDDAARDSVMRSRFSGMSGPSSPVQCLLEYDFTLTSPLRPEDSSPGVGIPTLWATEAQAGDAGAQLLYGLMLGTRGVPWLVKAAQAGSAAAQYELGRYLLEGWGCRKDEAKALRWLKMAADQGQPDAELALATRLLHGRPTDSDVTRAKAWLERAAGHAPRDGSRQGDSLLQTTPVRWPQVSLEHAEDYGVGDGSRAARLLLAAILATAPQSALRDPTRALQLLADFHDDSENPTPLEIRAAASAARGDYTDATLSEQSAMSRARRLHWDLLPLEERLASYQSRKPWYGSLIPL